MNQDIKKFLWAAADKLRSSMYAAECIATETAVFKHLFARYYAQNVRFSYWRGKRDHEVDLSAEVGGEVIPFEVKYRAQHTGARELKALIELCQAKRIARGYVITKSLGDFGRMQGLPSLGPEPAADATSDAPATTPQIMRIPAPLLCYWMGATETPTGAQADEEREAGRPFARNEGHDRPCPHFERIGNEADIQHTRKLPSVCWRRFQPSAAATAERTRQSCRAIT
jgi:hypothetical protein